MKCDQICVWSCDMTSRSYFGKMNPTLGSVVPLAMFLKYGSSGQSHWALLYIDIVRLKVIICVARRRWKKVFKKCRQNFFPFWWLDGWLPSKQVPWILNTAVTARKVHMNEHNRENNCKRRGVVAFCIKVDRNCTKFLSPDLPCFHFLMHSHFNFFQHVIFVIRWYRLFVVTWHQFRQSHLKIPAGSYRVFF